MLVAGIAGFKRRSSVGNPSASFLREWLENDTLVWLVTEEILSEYKEVLTRLGGRHHLVGQIISLLREEAEFVDVRGESDISPDPDDNIFCACAEDGAAAFIVTLNRKDFPQKRLLAKVISPGAPLPTTRRFFEEDLSTSRTALSESSGRDEVHIENDPEGLDIHLGTQMFDAYMKEAVLAPFGMPAQRRLVASTIWQVETPFY